MFNSWLPVLSVDQITRDLKPTIAFMHSYMNTQAGTLTLCNFDIWQKIWIIKGMVVDLQKGLRGVRA